METFQMNSSLSSQYSVPLPIYPRVGDILEDHTLQLKYCKSVFFWPTLFKDEYAYVKDCDQCQQVGNVSRRNEMTLTNIIEVEYILVAIDYVSKWVEVETYLTNDAKVVTQFLQKYIFTRFGTPRAIINDEGSHFWLLEKYNVKHKVATTYHHQTNGQAGYANKEIKGILEKVIRPNRRDWSRRLDEALWAYRKTFKNL
ncbi:Transposon Ty3-I Gag-Pol polyprotein [Gossypium australe]|uniref:Transposon Ty3-I Gag-Pol polyprotein n=1 Tax=Gossypium australe TaxID=47621 RepID=A0A5B6VNE4_9ROSI|nr:Transposon Ty3-I Gag-Pol polyprotein [Gossypium australe]